MIQLSNKKIIIKFRKLYNIVKISKDPECLLGLTVSDNDSVIDIDVKKKKKSPKLVATAYTSRHSGFYVYNAIFLIFLITASALSVFSINPNFKYSEKC